MFKIIINYIMYQLHIQSHYIYYIISVYLIIAFNPNLTVIFIVFTVIYIYPNNKTYKATKISN